jgi:eukaryotic-like serine/threonine-protein kinase
VFPRPDEPRTLAGFEILERLGRGGVGEVYLARSKRGNLVAIKFFDANASEDYSADQMAREAWLCARLKHTTIVQVRAFVEDGDTAALVFEYVPGVALTRVLRLCASHGVRLPDRAAWHVVERVLAALAYAHSLTDEKRQPTPIVHRDVSPSNVLVDWSGAVKLTDFGLAKMMGVSPTTRMGLVKGTLGCMAPEQARGEPVTERADVYAAALLAWRLATGRVPFAKHQKDEFEMLRAMRNPRIKPLDVLRPDLPEKLLGAVARALAPEAKERDITAVEFGEEVRAAFDTVAGRAELEQLLTRWKPALERTVRRADGGRAIDAGDSADSSARLIAHTLRYEEVALAFDEDEIADDAPTFQAHALPSESGAPPADEPRPSEDAILAKPALLPPSVPPPPPATLEDPRFGGESARPSPQPPAPIGVWARVVRRYGWDVVLAAVFFVFCLVVAFTFAR